MLVRDVRHFVAEHAGELRFVLDQRERAARDVHEPAGRRERVDAVGVEDDERPRQLRPLGLQRDRGADERHVFVDGRILDDPEPLADLQADVGANLDLFRFRDVQVVELLFLFLNFLSLVEMPPNCA